MDKDKDVVKINKQIIKKIIGNFLIYLSTIFVGIFMLRFFYDYLGFIPRMLSFLGVSSATDDFWFWAFTFACLFGYPFYRKKREVTRGLLSKSFLWLKSLNFTKEDYKKILSVCY